MHRPYFQLEFNENGVLVPTLPRDTYMHLHLRRAMSPDEVRMYAILQERRVDRLTEGGYMGAVHRIHTHLVEMDWMRWLMARQRPVWVYDPSDMVRALPPHLRMCVPWERYCGHMRSADTLLARLAGDCVLIWEEDTINDYPRVRSIEDGIRPALRVLIDRARHAPDRQSAAPLCDALKELIDRAMNHERQLAYDMWDSMMRYLTHRALELSNEQ